MRADWPTCKLRDVADVRVSNVDKKFYAAETPVKLCNYMDVYANDYVTASIDFMVASASKAEIERFGLFAGDVVITKDSETPDDIGVPAVIAEPIDGLVCGYHLALIRPRDDKINAVYLAKQLCSSPAIKYFAVNASGSTRFGLPVKAIEDLELPLAPKLEQTKISEIFLTVDRAIEQTEALIAKQQRIKAGLMQDLLTRGIDEHGNLRSEQTHKFKDSPLGRIPAEWDVAPISRCGARGRPYLRTGPFGSDLNTKHWAEYGVPVLTIGSLGEGEVLQKDLLFISESSADRLNGFQVIPGDIVFSRVADIGRSLVIQSEHSGWVISSNLMRISLDRNRARPTFLYRNIVSNTAVRAQLNTTSNSGGRDLVNGPILRALLFPWPDPDEQDRINERLDVIESSIRNLNKCLRKTHAHKTALMQGLLTGRRRVTALLDETEEAAIP